MRLKGVEKFLTKDEAAGVPKRAVLGDVAYGGSTFVAVGDRNQEPLVLTWEPSS